MFTSASLSNPMYELGGVDISSSTLGAGGGGGAKMGDVFLLRPTAFFSVDGFTLGACFGPKEAVFLFAAAMAAALGAGAGAVGAAAWPGAGEGEGAALGAGRGAVTT